MSEPVRVDIPGRPVAWQRPRSLGARHFTPRRVLEAEDVIAWHVRAAGVRFGGLDVELRIELWSKTTLRGDVDNYAKTVLDALEKAGAIDNDRQVRRLDVQFVVGTETEKIVVHLRPLELAA
jgi:Holliday junction resolvase RusA-like endonuclease